MKFEKRITMYSLQTSQVSTGNGFVAVVQNFLGSTRASSYIEIVQAMLEVCNSLGANMSIKVHYIHSDLNSATSNESPSTKTLRK